MKNKKAIKTLIIANAISHFAQGISMMAIPWYFINHLEEKEVYNLIFVVVTAITLFWSPYAGTLVDRYPRKNVMVGLMTVGMTLLLIAAFFGSLSGEVLIWPLTMVFGFTILNYNLHFPTLYAWTQEMTTSKSYGKVNAILEIQGQATTMLAGGLGVFLLQGLSSENLAEWGFGFRLPFEIKAWSIYEIFFMDACSYLIAILLILTIRYKRPETAIVDKEKIITRFKNGVRFLKVHPDVFRFGAFGYSIFVVLIVHAIFLLPIYVKDHLHGDARVFALSEVFYTIGALAAGVWIRKIFKKVHAVNGVLILMVLCIFVLLMLAFTQHYMVLFSVSILFGLSNSGARVLRITYLFENVPNHTIGRVASVFQSLNIGARLFIASMVMTPFFLKDITNAYLIEAGFVALCFIPLALNRKRIIANSQDTKS
ncbi:MAG: MFS transporter [Flavobacteriales bacterium]|nr:MFS transporter [Flavobacteriales bacterium]